MSHDSDALQNSFVIFCPRTPVFIVGILKEIIYGGGFWDKIGRYPFWEFTALWSFSTLVVSLGSSVLDILSLIHMRMRIGDISGICNMGRFSDDG